MMTTDAKAAAAADTKDVGTSNVTIEKSRLVVKLVVSREQGEGVGARVWRSIGGHELRNLDPFLGLDEFHVAAPAGFPDHPHRGFETVTYMLPTSKGSLNHEDFCGHKGTISAGDLQWMTAGRGIVHAEMPASKDECVGLQLWVNLSAKDKLCEPAYQELKSKDIPKASRGGISATIIAGEALGVKSNVFNRQPVHYIHFHMKPNSTLHHPIPKTFTTAFCYILNGQASFGGGAGAGDKQLCKARTGLVLSADGDGVIVQTAGDSEVDFVLITGQPTKESIVQHGPFVMNTRQQIQAALLDYQMGQNGFERASFWRSEIGRQKILPDDDDDVNREADS